MEKLDFAELHKEKLALIFENIDILNAMKAEERRKRKSETLIYVLPADLLHP